MPNFENMFNGNQERERKLENAKNAIEQVFKNFEQKVSDKEVEKN